MIQGNVLIKYIMIISDKAKLLYIKLDDFWMAFEW